MSNEYTVALSKLIKELALHEFYMPCSADEILIRSANVNRPGIELNGYYEYFDPERINLMGKAEFS
ncbi:MAG: HPr kinase/phosphorylase, partial [Clostridia bacterium]|nr:HPr kinase/phosphorylase [Clostridia bacterium]